jgi:hypothetical protein
MINTDACDGSLVWEETPDTGAQPGPIYWNGFSSCVLVSG